MALGQVLIKLRKGAVVISLGMAAFLICGYLIDINVIPELVRPKPDAAVLDWFGPRILSIDPDVADHWSRLLAQAGRPMPAIDSLLAATARHHDLRLVTRNTSDFDYAGLEVINPWQTAAR